MKKFSFLLLGVFLLGTLGVALADEAKDPEIETGTTTEVVTGTTAEIETGTTTEVETGTTTEVETGTTTEVVTGTTTEVVTGTTTEVVTGTTTEVATGTTTEVVTGTTTEVVTGTTTEVVTGTTTEVKTGTVAEVKTGTVVEVETGDIIGTTTENTDVVKPTISDAAKEKYNEEQIAAYIWAFDNGVTTMSDIDSARLSDGLTRAELAKMMVGFSVNIMGKELPTELKCKFSDISKIDSSLKTAVLQACELGIMGQGITKFRPNDKVIRAEFATVFSRVLYGDKYNKSEGKYYEDHIKALKEAGILTNDDPTMKEIRGWVMLMMYRFANIKVETPADEQSETSIEEKAETSTEEKVETPVEDQTGTVVTIANPASVYCEEQGGTLTIVEDAEGNQSGMCKLADGTEVEEWEYYRANHKEEIEPASGDVAPLYAEEDLKAAEKVITEEGFGKLAVKVENVKLKYMGDEKASLELKYCQELDSTVEECVVFESEFYIPEQDAQMAGAFEPDTTLTGYQWYLGRTKGGEWKILTAGY